MPPPIGHPESALLDAVKQGHLQSEAELLAAVRSGSPPTGARPQATPFLRAVDWFLPPQLLRAGLDLRRRARFVVIIAFVVVPFYGVLVQQLLANGLIPQAVAGICFGLASLAGPFLLRRARSHVVPGTIVCISLSLVVFIQAYTDAGLSDPILYWAALVPLAAALSVGPRLSVACAAINLAGIAGLYVLTVRGYTFPHLTPPAGLHLSALLSVGTSTLFALLWGWLYERHTLRELRTLSGRLGELHHALVRSEARYRSLFDTVPLGVYRTTPEGRVLMVNPALVKLLGYRTAEEVQALQAADVYPDPEHRERFRTQIEAAGEVHQFASTWKRRDGRWLHVRENARAVFDEAGRPLYYEGTVEDVTAQRRVQQALRKSEERFRSLAQNASDVIVVLNREGAMTYLSPSIRRILGYAPGDLERTAPFDLVHPEERRRVQLLFHRALCRRGNLGQVEARVLHADGHYVYVESVGANLLHDPNVGGLVLNVRDVTERKRAEMVLVRAKEQAEEVARLKSTFLANMSHEIRTPLTGILGFAGILAEEITDPQLHEFVGLIEKSGRRLMETLNSVLDLARLEAGRMELTLEARPLGELAEEHVRLMQPLAQDRDLLLETDLRAPEVQARVDVGAFNRILTNLVGNALKFTEEGGVRVEVDADEVHAILRVRDTGVGIDAAFLPRLFDEFEQESTGIERSHEGSGLGLTITRQLVERMHGTIDVESVKGIGSVFTVRLPRTDAAAEAPSVFPDDAEEDLPTPRLLVVDDNANTRHLVARMLRGVYRVDTAGTAPDAVAAAEAVAYDAVLLDINLGAKTSGVDVMHRMRALPGYAETPIFAFTAYALPGDRERFLNAGFSGYLPKPFTKPELLGVLQGAREEPSADPAPEQKEPAPAVLHMIIPGPGARPGENVFPFPSGDGAASRPVPAEDPDEAPSS